MSQPLWFLRQDDRIIGPFPAPQVREFLKLGEITPDWEISLDEQDWISIRESGQFDDVDLGRPHGPSEGTSETANWRAERAEARQRWLHEGQTVENAQTHDITMERRARQAMALHQDQTDALVQSQRSRRPPILAGLLALLLLSAAIYFIVRGQSSQTQIQTGIDLRPNCSALPGDGVNWSLCNKAGLQAPGAQGRNMRLEGVNLSGANLQGADFSYGAFRGSNLRNSNLRGTQFLGADLSGVDFSGADLREADLSYAVLKGAILEGARLEGARLSKATWVDGSLCPDGAVDGCP